MHAHTHTHILKDRQKNIERERHIHRHTLTDRQIERERDTHTHTHTPDGLSLLAILRHIILKVQTRDLFHSVYIIRVIFLFPS